MSNKIRHVLGISGGKDSAALAIYLNNLYPDLDIEYYFCDTGKELEETYNLINNLEVYLGKKIVRLEAASKSHKDPFDHYLQLYGGFLPSARARWCTKKLKLEPFEKFVGDDPTISYVGIRDDENREGYISKKSNIQSIFPFRKNIWSKDVVNIILKNANIDIVSDTYKQISNSDKLENILEVVDTPLSIQYSLDNKLDSLLSIDTLAFNKVVFNFLQNTNYPLSRAYDFPLIHNNDSLIRDDIFKILRESGVGVPAYYEKIEFEHNGQKGEYARSRSGCFFCFFQQKIEWVWLYEQHPEQFKKAMEYEKEGFTWMKDEKLENLIKPGRLNKIKEDQLNITDKNLSKKSPYLIDILEEAEEEGCTACFL